MALGDVVFKWLRTQLSSSAKSITLYAFETPILSQKSLIASAGYPLRRIPLIVAILGSSHPSTMPSFTSLRHFRLEVNV